MINLLIHIKNKFCYYMPLKLIWHMFVVLLLYCICNGKSLLQSSGWGMLYFCSINSREKIFGCCTVSLFLGM